MKAWPATWRAAGLRLALAWIGLVLLFRADWAEMAGQWWNSSTYTHILLIPAILAWLVWQRAGELARLVPRGWWPGLLLAAFAMLVWVAGAFAGVSTLRQLGAVALLIAAALALLGPRVGVGLAFPLGYMLLLVPFGDELVPTMQMVTARITIALVHVSGIPARIDGVFIDTPAGLFEVAEACSGVKFLVAMAAFGFLLASVCFVSWRRRMVVFGACLIVPVLANGLRAWGTIFAAQHIGVERAAGIDHIVYGWVFFAVVVALIVAGAWRHFDRPPGDPMIDADRINGSALLGRLEAMGIRPALALAALASLALAGQAWADAAERLKAAVPGQIFLPEVPGWQRVDYAPLLWWEPRASGAEHRLIGRYADRDGREVDVFVALYAAQGEGREAGGFGEGALPPASGWAWLKPGPEAEGAASVRLLGKGQVERLALTWYRTGALTTGSNARLKLAAMADRLLLRPRPTMVLILSAEERDGRPAHAAIADFRRAMGPLDRWMDRIARLR